MPNAADQSQDEVCCRYGQPVVRPSAAQYVGIDQRVLLPAVPTVYGARYPALSEADTGWWLTTSTTDDDAPQMVKVHVGHLADVCPAVLPFLALPVGWYFDTSSGAAAYDPSLLTD